jgi:hypothetical protein
VSLGRLLLLLLGRLLLARRMASSRRQGRGRGARLVRLGVGAAVVAVDVATAVLVAEVVVVPAGKTVCRRCCAGTGLARDQGRRRCRRRRPRRRRRLLLAREARGGHKPRHGLPRGALHLAAARCRGVTVAAAGRRPRRQLVVAAAAAAAAADVRLVERHADRRARFFHRRARAPVNLLVASPQLVLTRLQLGREIGLVKFRIVHSQPREKKIARF